MNNEKENMTFAEKHPRWNLLIGLVFLIVIIIVGIFVIVNLIKAFGEGLDRAGAFLSGLASHLDVVIIVALITSVVSIVSVLFTSVVSKYIEYKQRRREYLYQKRETPYADFVEMVYKLQEEPDGEGGYVQNGLSKDMQKISKMLTL